MARPVTLTPQAVIQALTLTPQAPTVLATKLGVSRATLHRKLRLLEAEGLVTKVGQGPTAAYRRWTPSDVPSSHLSGALVRWSLPESTVFYVLEALDLYTRLGIGQLEILEEHLRMGSFSPEDDRELTFRILDRAKSVIQSLKMDVLGFQSGASFGIHHPSVNPGVSRTWYLLKVLRHRLSWDRQPAGGHGVGHDEPMFNDMGATVRVHSFLPLASADSPAAPERTYRVDMDLETAHAAALACQAGAHIESRRYPELLPLFETGVIKARSLKALDHVALAHAQTMLCTLESQVKQLHISERWQQRALALAEAGGTMLKLVTLAVSVPEFDADTASVLSENAALSGSSLELVGATGNAPFESLEYDLPSSVALGWRGNECRVMDVNVGVYVGRSHSIQTALQMARNYAEGASQATG